MSFWNEANVISIAEGKPRTGNTDEPQAKDQQLPQPYRLASGRTRPANGAGDPRWQPGMKLPSAFAASVLLALFIAMGYIGFDISRQLTVPVQLALAVALLLDLAALYLAVRGRRRAARPPTPGYRARERGTR